jgi:hypothetical protein
MKLPMAALDSNLNPAVGFQQRDEFFDFHRASLPPRHLLRPNELVNRRAATAAREREDACPRVRLNEVLAAQDDYTLA